MIDVGQIRWEMSLWVRFQCKLGSAVTVGFLCEMIYLGLFHSLVVLLERGLNPTQSCLSPCCLPVGQFRKLFPEEFRRLSTVHATFVILPENWKGVFLNVESTSLAFMAISGKFYCVMMIMMMIDFVHFCLVWFIVLIRNMLISICAII